MLGKNGPAGVRLRRSCSILSASVAATLLGLVTAIPAGAEVIPPGSPQYGKIYGLASSPANCVDAWGNRPVDGDPVDVYGCINEDGQQWTYNISHNDIRSGLPIGPNPPQFCLTSVRDTPYQNPNIPNEIAIVHCDGGAWQVWRIIGQTLYNPASGECLDDTAYGGQGTYLGIWPCNGGSNQNWDIVGYSSD